MIYTLVSCSPLFSFRLSPFGYWHRITFALQVLPFLPDLFTKRLRVPERQGMPLGGGDLITVR